MKPKAISTISTVPAVSGTERNMLSGSSGSCARVSQKREDDEGDDAPPPGTPGSRGRPSPTSGALMRAQIRQNIAADSSTMPGTSKERGAFSRAVVPEDHQAQQPGRGGRPGR